MARERPVLSLPFEFVVSGPPVSQQGRNSQVKAWRRKVATAARAHLIGDVAPHEGPVRFVVVYYHKGPSVRLDTDNMLKPVQDALIGILYADDRQITDNAVRKTRIDQAFKIVGASALLTAALVRGEEFLHIIVGVQPDHSEPLK